MFLSIHQNRKISIGVSLILAIAVSLWGLLFAVRVARADVDPIACTDNGGGISIAAFRADGVTSIGSADTVVDGELIKYKATLSALSAPNCAFEGGTWTLTTPDAVVHALGSVPRIGGTGVSTFASALISYTTAHANEIVGGTRHIDASTAYGGGISHADSNDQTTGPALGASKITNVIHTPTVVTDIHDASHAVVTSVPVGTTVHDKATVTGEAGGPAPTGTVSFTRYSDAQCTTNATTSGTVALVAGVADPSNSFATVSAGSLSFKAHYNGDLNYVATDATCEPLTVIGRSHLIVDKITIPGGDTTVFSINATGTGTITGGGAGTTTDATNKDYEVTPGTYSVSETVPAGWTQTSNTCTGVTVGSGETKTCIITNTKNIVQVQYCSPGYWKQSQHFDSYVTYVPTDLFNTVFGSTAFPGKTLVDVLSTGGGGLIAYGRATVGALLNSAALTSGLTPAQVISAFNTTFAGAPTSGNTNGYYGSANPEFTAPESCPLN